MRKLILKFADLCEQNLMKCLIFQRVNIQAYYMALSDFFLKFTAVTVQSCGQTT